MAANRRKVRKNRKKNRRKWGEKSHHNIYSSSPPLTTPSNRIIKGKLKTKISHCQETSQVLLCQNQQKPRKWHFTHTAFLTMDPSWVSHVQDIHEALGSRSELERNSKPCLSEKVVASRAVWAHEHTPASWGTSAPGQGCPDCLGSHPDSSPHWLCEYESVS